MSAQVQDAASFFGGLSNAEQVRFLVRFGWELTILGRSTYEVGGEDLTDPPMLRAINEMQHRLLGHLRDLLAASHSRRSDEDLMGVLLGLKDDQLRGGAVAAYNRTVERFRRDS